MSDDRNVTAVAKSAPKTRRLVLHILTTIFAVALMCVSAFPKATSPLSKAIGSSLVVNCQELAAITMVATLRAFGMEADNSAGSVELVDKAKSWVCEFSKSSLFGGAETTLIPSLILMLAGGLVVITRWRMGWIRNIVVLLAAISILLVVPALAGILQAILVKTHASDVESMHDILYLKTAQSAGTIMGMAIVVAFWRLIKALISEDDGHARTGMPIHSSLLVAAIGTVSIFALASLAAAIAHASDWSRVWEVDATPSYLSSASALGSVLLLVLALAGKRLGHKLAWVPLLPAVLLTCPVGIGLVGSWIFLLVAVAISTSPVRIGSAACEPDSSTSKDSESA